MVFHSFVTGEVDFLGKKGVINLKLLEYSLKSNDQPGSSYILLSKVLEVHGVCYEKVQMQLVHILNRLHHQQWFWIPVLWVLHQEPYQNTHQVLVNT